MTEYPGSHYQKLVTKAYHWYEGHLLARNIKVFLLTSNDSKRYSGAVHEAAILTTLQFIQYVLPVSYLS